MTIAVAVRTESALVFAADSKLTTRAPLGRNADGSLNWVEQTYDNATKVVHDKSKQVMAMVAGDANVGRITALDYIAMQELPGMGTVGELEAQITRLLDEMLAERRAFWSATAVPTDEWPGPTLLIAAAAPSGVSPRLWRAVFTADRYDVAEPLDAPGVRLEGSYLDAFGLLFGWRLDVLDGLSVALGVDESRMMQAVQDNLVLRPVDRVNCTTMPLQDAIDLSVFLATVQIEMDRFLPGPPACGGAIDVMVLRTVPRPEILALPGKEIHHPLARAKL